MLKSLSQLVVILLLAVPLAANAWLIAPQDMGSCVSRFAQQGNEEVAKISIQVCYLFLEKSRNDKRWMECALEKNKKAKTIAVARYNIRMCQEQSNGK